MEFLNNLKFITLIVVSLAISTGFVDAQSNANLVNTDYIAY
jgi:hypothetical protein